jgi:hypothetical protein
MFQHQRFQNSFNNFNRTGYIGSIQTAVRRLFYTGKYMNLGFSLGNNFTIFSKTIDKLEVSNNLMSLTKQKGLTFGYYGDKTKETMLFIPKFGLSMQIKFKTFAIAIDRDISLTLTASYSSEINRSLYIPSLRAGIAFSLK